MVSVEINEASYVKALRKGHNYAWDGQWEKALAEYKKAAACNPDASDPYVGMGIAYARLGRWEEALEAYRKAAAIEPYDPLLKERLARALAKVGKKKEAAETFIAAAEAYWQRKNIRKALENLTQAIKSAPNLPEAHLKLAQIYERIGKRDLAAKAYVSLASLYRDKGSIDEALKYCNLALGNDPDNLKAKALKASLQYGERLLPSIAEETPEASPVERSRKQALTHLAEIIFEEPAAPGRRIDTLLGQALDAQSRGDLNGAIASYKQVLEAGLDIPDVHFNLGLLYKEKLMIEEAIHHLTKALKSPQYALGSHFALGECYKISGQVDKALAHFLEALKIVDLSTVGHTQADELIKLYRNLADSFVARGDREKAFAFIQSLMDFFNARGWEDKVKELREHIRALEDEGIALSLAEVMEAPNPEEVFRSLSLSQELMKRKLLESASEECFRGIASAPFCLPLHIQMAEILIKGNRIEEATEKYLLIARDYELRGIPYRAISILKRLIRLVPMDVSVRVRLINTLISFGHIDEAMEQYMQLGEVFYELADIKKAIESYRQALLLTPRSSKEEEWRAKILYRLGDLYVQVMQWKEALEAYSQLKELDPKDKEVRKRLVTLYIRLKLADQASKEVEELIDLYRQEGKLSEMAGFLEELAQEQPEDQMLRSALAKIYLELGLKDKAIEQLDFLGELQLDAGKFQEAKETISTIISLNPREVGAYQELLKRLERGEIA